jgi:lipoprotein-anchoring transpeptidase ErfK/SrfK
MSLLLAAVEVVAALMIDLSAQRLYAYDAHGRLLYAAPVSTGLAATPTPAGDFRIASKYPVTALTAPTYRIPGVPNVLCLGGGGLRPDAVCIHPAPWQERAGQPFGVRRSHGCIRTSSATARWLFERVAVGIPVTVREIGGAASRGDGLGVMSPDFAACSDVKGMRLRVVD